MNFYHADDIPSDLSEFFEPAPQLGLEATPDAYVAKMVEVFREVRRTLRDDGTLWLNIGDCFAGQPSGCQGENGQRADRRFTASVPAKRGAGLKPKDLIGIPWMLAFALRADGWWLRSEIIWAKPSTMPESVTDRPTKAHEQIFLLAKSADYYYDAAAIAEPCVKGGRSSARPRASGGDAKTRNKRSVWTVASAPYSGAHFATFPPDLIKPCILAGCPPGGIVLDPFLGSGTTAMVAESLGRRWFGCDLNPEYGKLISERTAQAGMVFG